MNIIKSAKMENFRGYGEKGNSIAFSPGVNLVLGDNATGKSSIVTTIVFNLLHKKLDVSRFEDYRTIEPRDMHKFRAGLAIKGTDGQDYTIEKILQGTQVKICISCDGTELKKVGELELNRQKDAQTFILEKLGAREEIVDDILVQIQDPVKLLWPVGDAAKVGSELSRLLRLEQLQNIYSNGKSVENMLDGKIKDFEREAIETKQYIEEQGLKRPDEYKNERLKLEERINAFRKSHDETKIEKEKNYKIRESEKAKFEDLIQKKGDIRTLNKQLGRHLKIIKGKKEPKKSIESLESERTNSKEKYKSVDKEHRRLENELTKLETSKNIEKENKNKLIESRKKHLQKYNDLIKSLRALGFTTSLKKPEHAGKLIDKNRRGFDELLKTLGKLEERIETEGDYTEILSEAKANCPVCDTRLTAKQREKILKEKEQQIEKLKQELEKKRTESEETEEIVKQLDKLKIVLEKLSEFTTDISEYTAKLMDISKKIPGYAKQKRELGKELIGLEDEISLLEGQIDLKKEFTEARSLRNELKGLQKEVKALPKISKKLGKLETRIKNLQEKVTNLHGQIEGLKPELRNLTQQESQAESWYKKFETAKDRAGITSEFSKEVRLAYEAAMLSLREAFADYCGIINSNLDWLWPRLYDRPDLRKVELKAEVKEEEEGGEITLKPEIQLMRLGAGDEKIPFNTISSHGQRVLASIAFRIAFLNILWKTNVPKVLVLDEPTIWVDNNNRERLGHLLASLVKEVKEGGIKIEQLIIISHDPAFLNAIDPEGLKHVCVKNSEGFCEVATAIAE